MPEHALLLLFLNTKQGKEDTINSEQADHNVTVWIWSALFAIQQAHFRNFKVHERYDSVLISRGIVMEKYLVIIMR